MFTVNRTISVHPLRILCLSRLSRSVPSRLVSSAPRLLVSSGLPGASVVGRAKASSGGSWSFLILPKSNVASSIYWTRDHQVFEGSETESFDSPFGVDGIWENPTKTHQEFL